MTQVPTGRSSKESTISATDSKRILFVHLDLGIGGAENLIVSAAKGLRARGHEVEIYTAYYDPNRSFPDIHLAKHDEESEDEEDRAPVDEIQQKRTKEWRSSVPVRVFSMFPPHMCGYFTVMFSILRMLYICLNINWSSWDVIVNDQVSQINPWLRMLARQKLMFYCHYPDLLLAKKKSSFLGSLYRGFFDWLEKVTIFNCDVLCVNSNFTKKVFKETFPDLVQKEAKKLQKKQPALADKSIDAVIDEHINVLYPPVDLDSVDEMLEYCVQYKDGDFLRLHAEELKERLEKSKAERLAEVKLLEEQAKNGDEKGSVAALKANAGKYKYAHFQETLDEWFSVCPLLMKAVKANMCAKGGSGGNTKIGNEKAQNAAMFLSLNRYERKKKTELALQGFVNMVKARLRHTGKYPKGKDIMLDDLSRSLLPVETPSIIIAGGYDERVEENKEYYNELKTCVLDSLAIELYGEKGVALMKLQMRWKDNDRLRRWEEKQEKSIFSFGKSPKDDKSPAKKFQPSGKKGILINKDEKTPSTGSSDQKGNSSSSDDKDDGKNGKNGADKANKDSDDDLKLPEKKIPFTAEELETLIHYEIATSRVIFLKSIPTYLKYFLFKSASAVVYTPADEHFGIVPIEVMACKSLVIAHKSGGPVESVGSAGFLVQDHTAEAFQNAMESVCKLPKKNKEQLEDQSRVNCEDHFSHKQFTKRLVDLLAIED